LAFFKDPVSFAKNLSLVAAYENEAMTEESSARGENLGVRNYY